MPTQGSPLTSFQSSRRYLVRMGAIVACALIVKKTAAADNFRRYRDRG